MYAGYAAPEVYGQYTQEYDDDEKDEVNVKKRVLGLKSSNLPRHTTACHTLSLTLCCTNPRILRSLDLPNSECRNCPRSCLFLLLLVVFHSLCGIFPHADSARDHMRDRVFFLGVMTPSTCP